MVMRKKRKRGWELDDALTDLDFLSSLASNNFKRGETISPPSSGVLNTSDEPDALYSCTKFWAQAWSWLPFSQKELKLVAGSLPSMALTCIDSLEEILSDMKKPISSVSCGYCQRRSKTSGVI